MQTPNSTTHANGKNAVDEFSHTAHNAAGRAADLTDSARTASVKTGEDIASGIDAIKRDGAKLLSEYSELARDKFASVSESTTQVIRQDPVKAVLIAAAAGAALVALVGLLGRARRA